MFNPIKICPLSEKSNAPHIPPGKTKIKSKKHQEKNTFIYIQKILLQLMNVGEIRVSVHTQINDVVRKKKQNDFSCEKVSANVNARSNCGHITFNRLCFRCKIFELKLFCILWIDTCSAHCAYEKKHWCGGKRFRARASCERNEHISFLFGLTLLQFDCVRYVMYGAEN